VRVFGVKIINEQWTITNDRLPMTNNQLPMDNGQLPIITEFVKIAN
jgi:hypothetical protein